VNRRHAEALTAGCIVTELTAKALKGAFPDDVLAVFYAGILPAQRNHQSVFSFSPFSIELVAEIQL